MTPNSTKKKYGTPIMLRSIKTNLGVLNTMVHSERPENEVKTTLLAF